MSRPAANVTPVDDTSGDDGTCPPAGQVIVKVDGNFSSASKTDVYTCVTPQPAASTITKVQPAQAAPPAGTVTITGINLQGQLPARVCPASS